MFTTQLLLSISRILNVLLVLGIVLFSFAVAGVEFFGDVRYGAFLNGNRNFDDIPNTLMMLVRVTFSEWVYARHDCRVQPPGCTEGYDCGSVMATPYFALLLLLNAYILANMFVAVVLTDFTWLVSHHPAYFTVTVLSLSLSGHLPFNLTITYSHTLLITCTCCYDEIKGTKDQDFSCSFSDSLCAHCALLLCSANGVFGVQLLNHCVRR